MLMSDQISALTESGKLMPVLAVLIAQHILVNDDYCKMFTEFSDMPDAETFVNVHEDFYQAYKNNEYQVGYYDIVGKPRNCTHSFKDKFAIIRENKAKADSTPDIPIIPFETFAFSEEYRSLIPDLSEEFADSFKCHCYGRCSCAAAPRPCGNG